MKTFINLSKLPISNNFSIFLSIYLYMCVKWNILWILLFSVYKLYTLTRLCRIRFNGFFWSSSIFYIYRSTDGSQNTYTHSQKLSQGILILKVLKIFVVNFYILFVHCVLISFQFDIWWLADLWVQLLD